MNNFEKNSTKYACAIIDLVLFDKDWQGDLYGVGQDLIKKVRSINQEIKIIAYSKMGMYDEDLELSFVEDKVIFYNRILQKDIVSKIKNLLK